MKVAILDDDLLFCEMLKDYLSSYHFDISIFTRYQWYSTCRKFGL